MKVISNARNIKTGAAVAGPERTETGHVPESTTCPSCASGNAKAAIACLKGADISSAVPAVYTAGCASVEENGAPLGLHVPEGNLAAFLSRAALDPTHFSSVNLHTGANTLTAPDAAREHVGAGVLITADVPEDVGAQTITFALTSGYAPGGGALTAITHTLTFGVGNSTALLLAVRTDRGRPQLSPIALRDGAWPPYGSTAMQQASSLVITMGTIPSGMTLRARIIGANDPVWASL